MTEDSIKVPDSLPNLAAYYERAVTAFFCDPMRRWSESEKQVIGEIVGEYAGHHASKYGNVIQKQALDVPCVDTILTDMDDLCLPKHVCLLKWLAPDGICIQEPKLLSEIAKLYL